VGPLPRPPSSGSLSLWSQAGGAGGGGSSGNVKVRRGRGAGRGARPGAGGAPCGLVGLVVSCALPLCRAVPRTRASAGPRRCRLCRLGGPRRPRPRPPRPRKVVVRVKPEDGAAAQAALQVRGNTGIKLLAPKPLDFEGFSWVAGPQASQDDIMAREWARSAAEGAPSGVGARRRRRGAWSAGRGAVWPRGPASSRPPCGPPTAPSSLPRAAARRPPGVGAPMVDSLRAGFNSTILAYGDSGSGKTHTMIGPPGAFGEAEVRRRARWRGAAPRPLDRSAVGAPAAGQQRDGVGRTCVELLASALTWDAPQEGLIPRVLKSLFGKLVAEFGPATAEPSAAASCGPSAHASECGDGGPAASAAADDGASSCCGSEAPSAAGRTTWSAEMAFLQVRGVGAERLQRFGVCAGAPEPCWWARWLRVQACAGLKWRPPPAHPARRCTSRPRSPTCLAAATWRPAAAGRPAPRAACASRRCWSPARRSCRATSARSSGARARWWRSRAPTRRSRACSRARGCAPRARRSTTRTAAAATRCCCWSSRSARRGPTARGSSSARGS
jgi:hypothetical protein